MTDTPASGGGAPLPPSRGEFDAYLGDMENVKRCIKLLEDRIIRLENLADAVRKMAEAHDSDIFPW